MDFTLIEGLENLPDGPPGGLAGCVLTAGNFDGVHLGHRRILSAAASLADKTNAQLCALTFNPSPAEVLAPERAPDRILPPDVKYRLLARSGAQVVVVVKTTREFLTHRPEDFVRDVLAGRLAPGHIVEGHNFFFGRDRGGTVETLREMSGKFGFDVTVVEPLLADIPGRGRVRVSSSLVRDLIRGGDVDSAARCLGRAFTLYGRVVGGQRRGRLLDFPTANVDPDGVIVPADGVYAAWTRIGDTRYRSAVSIGTKPTFGPAPTTIEVHVIDAHGDFYEKPIAVTFLARLRDQEKFPDAQALKAEIAKDVRRVRELCK